MSSSQKAGRGCAENSYLPEFPEHIRRRIQYAVASTHVFHIQHKALAGNMKNCFSCLKVPQCSVHPAREESVLILGSPFPVMRDYPFDDFFSVNPYELLNVLDGLLGLG